MMGRRFYVQLKHHQDVPIRRRGNEPLRYLGDVPPRRCWAVQKDVVMTSPQRLVARWNR